MIPTSTGAAKAITSIFPHLTGKLGGAGIRVPVPNGSLTDFTCILKKQVTVAQINEAFLSASQNSLKGIGYNMPQHIELVKSGKPFDIVFQLQLNEWQGNQTVQLQVLDIKATLA